MAKYYWIFGQVSYKCLKNGFVGREIIPKQLE